MLVVATRPAENPAAQAVLAKLATTESATVLTPAPLSEAGVGDVLRDAFGAEPAEALTRRCAKASGGNVFYVRELIRPLVAAGLLPDATAERSIDLAGPAALTRTVRARLGELGPAATDLAVAAAVLGDGASLRHVIALARLDPDEAGQQAARLTGAAILATPEPVSFVHPLIRAAVEQTAAPGVVDGLHSRAAGILRAAGQQDRDVVQHLAAASPAADEQVCRMLLSEARTDMEAGSIAVAHRLLIRAVAEPPPPDMRPDVLLALAGTERAIGDVQGARAHLDEVVKTGTRAAAIAAMSDLFEVLYGMDDDEAVRALHRRALAIEPYGDTPEELRLRAMLLAHAAIGMTPAAPARLVTVDVDRLPARSGEERHLLICAAIHRRATRAGSIDAFTRRLRRAVSALPQDRPLTYWEVFAALEAAAFLASVEAMDEAHAVLRQIVPDVARLRVVAPDLQAEWNHRTSLNVLRRGRFEEALAHLAVAGDFADRHGLTVYTSLAEYGRGCVAWERGDYAEAGRLILRGPTDRALIAAQGLLLSGRPAEALSSLASFGFAVGLDAPVQEMEIQFEPHLIASHAYGLLGDRDRARAEAERELRIRRLHGPAFRLALALRRRATLAPTREALPLLAEAVEVCADTARLPVKARVRAGHGAALRRAGRLAEARAELTAVLDLADRLGMVKLRDQVAANLRSAGGRPRRTRTIGVDSLTESQLVVAQLAAAGRTNRQIAEDLYISVKTVETHLAATYRKLGTIGREGLASALDDASPGQAGEHPVDAAHRHRGNSGT
jgi:DNA-binding CsgD family transcriptional regulator